ncbi:hypothetical protein [Bradyrhizobium valentinum]|uniref:hypothetical protein n=1 Tax=Bradyrhizobium valentinum TaxID=1518501 RepID=UPI000A8F6722|nr:hypothetical protein [Bradyrhizobium valentinum]
MSPNPIELRLSPFAECGRTTSNIGYRDVLTGQVVASVEIPSELIERAVLANVSVEISLSADGEIASAASGTASACSSAKEVISVDQLVERFLGSDNLHMEEATERELQVLLERLQKSVGAVERSIALYRQATGKVVVR